MDKHEILFAKLREGVIIPSKRVGDAGFDLYAHFDENQMYFEPHETRMIPTGLMCAFHHDYVMILKERGSTGSKGIGQRCGVIDSGYRGEIFVPLTNHNDKPMLIIKKTDEDLMKKLSKKYVLYPYEKAICQALILPIAPVQHREATVEEVLSISSERGAGCLGSSGK